jgi:hypothetical protein
MIWNRGHILVMVLVSFAASSCATASGARALYAQTVAGFIGQPQSAVKLPYWWLHGPPTPTEQKALPNGNTLYVYNSRTGNGLCEVTVEVSQTTNLIVNAQPNGDGCITPY